MVDLVRQLGDHDAGTAAAVLFDLDDAAHPDRAAPGPVGVEDALVADDQPGGGEVGALDAFDDRLEGGLLVGLEVLQAPVHGVGQFPQIMRRDVGGHADGDTAGAVGEQVGEPARQNRRLLHPTVIVRDEIDCLLVDFAQHLHGQRGEPGLRVVADESVGDERVIVGLNPQAVHGLHAGFDHGRHGGVVEPSVGQLGRDSPHIGVRDVFEDLSARTLPARQPIDVVLTKPFLVDPATTAVRSDECRQPRDRIAIESGRDLGQITQDREELLLLGAAEPDLGSERLGMPAVGDDDLVLTGGVEVAPRDNAELEQQLLDILREPVAAGRIRNLNGVSRQCRARPVAFEQRLQECPLHWRSRVPDAIGDRLGRRPVAPQFREWTRGECRQVVDVQFEQRGI